MESGNQTQSRAPKFARYALIGAVAILIATLGYGLAGRKSAPDPVANTSEPAPITLASLQDATRTSPNDPKAWAELGEAYFARDEYPDAVQALEHATALDPKGSGYWSALGEARVYASQRDPMPGPALDAFRKAVALDAKDPRARYFLAVKRDLDGDHKGAIDDWFALLADTPPGAAWEKDVRRTITQSGKKYGIEVASRMPREQPVAAAAANPGTLPGPDAQQLAAASSLTPGQQEDMGRGMVAQLEQRLKREPNNLDGWVMLMRSRMTLGEPAKAGAALRDAIAANPGKKTELEAQARALGVPR